MLRVPQSPDMDNYIYAIETFSPHWASKVSFRWYFDKWKPKCALHIPCFASGKVKGNTRYIFLVHFSYCFFKYADLRRFCLEAQYKPVSSFVAGFPKLLKADPPASGKGAKSCTWQFSCVPCMLLLHPYPDPLWITSRHVSFALGFVFSKTPPQIVLSKITPLTVSL